MGGRYIWRLSTGLIQVTVRNSLEEDFSRLGLYFENLYHVLTSNYGLRFLFSFMFCPFVVLRKNGRLLHVLVKWSCKPFVFYPVSHYIVLLLDITLTTITANFEKWKRIISREHCCGQCLYSLSVLDRLRVSMLLCCLNKLRMSLCYFANVLGFLGVFNISAKNDRELPG